MHSLRVRKLSWFPEAWVYFGIGLFMSMIVAVASSDQLSRIETQLHKSFAEMFFIVLLPPIIFESGVMTCSYCDVPFHEIVRCNSSHGCLFVADDGFEFCFLRTGYSMDKGVFFVNFWSICMYAFLGTLLSMIVVAVMILLTSVASIIYPFSAVDAFCYGSIISATDPVTVLAVFQVRGLGLVCVETVTKFMSVCVVFVVTGIASGSDALFPGVWRVCAE